MGFLALFVFSAFYGIWKAGGWWAVGGVVAALWLSECLIRWAVKSHRNFRSLDPPEKALRRASQGFAVMVFAVLLTVLSGGRYHRRTHGAR